jgi:hypothetical protein
VKTIVTDLVDAVDMVDVVEAAWACPSPMNPINDAASRSLAKTFISRFLLRLACFSSLQFNELALSRGDVKYHERGPAFEPSAELARVDEREASDSALLGDMGVSVDDAVGAMAFDGDSIIR